MLRGNDRSKSQFLSGELVICFAVITGVSKNRSKVDSSCRLSNQSFELANIRVRASASSKGDDEMVGDIYNNSKLRVTLVGNGFPRALFGRSSFDEVGTCGCCVEPS